MSHEHPEYQNLQGSTAHELLTRYTQGAAPILWDPAGLANDAFNPKQARNKFEFQIERALPIPARKIEKAMGPKAPWGRSILQAVRSNFEVK